MVSLIELTLGTTDGEGNTALHHACIGANHAIIALLIDKYGSISVAKRNEHRKLPIDLLFEIEAVSDVREEIFNESNSSVDESSLDEFAPDLEVEEESKECRN